MKEVRSNGAIRTAIASSAVVAILIALMALSGSPIAAQQQEQKKRPEQKPPRKVEEDQTIKLDTKLVNVLFSAQDKQNRYINDLKQEDIQVLENNQQQEIFTFKREFDLPLTLVLLVDVSGSEQYTLPLLKDAGGQFIDSVIRTGKDTAGVIKFEGEATVMQNLTSNPARVRRALEEVAFIPPPPGGVFGGGTPPINGGSRQGGTSLYDAIVATSADMLANEPGRKTIIVLTDGEDTTSRMKIGDAIDEALRAEVVVYSIGIGDPGYGGVNKGVLNRISEATGGRAVFPKRARDLEEAFIQLEQDLRQQYLLAYTPKNETADGSFRKIEIRVSNRKDLKIQHRKGYFAPKGELD
ncbi:MAG: VWA domain-containing protein [Acidobacteriota bacterium]|nr:MAG: VWA domain-containing protein [Acidobacteriota bacterium]